MLVDLLKTDMYNSLNEDIRKGLFCSFISFTILDNMVIDFYEYHTDELFKAVGKYFKINFDDVETKLYNNYDFSSDEYINILNRCDVIEHKGLNKLILFLREEGNKLEKNYRI